MSRLDPNPNNRKKAKNPSATTLRSLDLKGPPPDLTVYRPTSYQAETEQKIAIEAIQSARGFCSAQTDVDRDYQWRIMQEKLVCASCGRRATEHIMRFNCAFDEGSYYRRDNTPPPYVWSYQQDNPEFAMCPECMFNDYSFIGPHAAGAYRPVMSLEDNDHSVNWRNNDTLLTSTRAHQLMQNHERKRRTNPSLPQPDLEKVKKELLHRASIDYCANVEFKSCNPQWNPSHFFKDNVPDYTTLALSYITTTTRKKHNKREATDPLELPRQRLKLEPEATDSKEEEEEKKMKREKENGVNV